MMTAVVPGCGNGIIEDDEECDGAELLGASCETRGFVSGTLSCTSSCLYNTTQCVAPPSSTGGSGGGGGRGSGGGKGTNATTSNSAQVVVTGLAAPFSEVTLLKDAQIVATAVADAKANFQISDSGLASGRHNFSLYFTDNKKRRSSTIAFPVTLTLGILNKVEGIFPAPTLVTDKAQVKQSEAITFSGQTVPLATIELAIGTAKYTVTAGADGAYSYEFKTSAIKQGKYAVTVRAISNKLNSSISKPYSFTVGNNTVLNQSALDCVTKGDLNNDCRVNLTDFSILAFWYQKVLTPAFAIREKDHLSGDGQVNIIDFSIMAFHWTG